mgnify:CR=1 FL=1
MPFDLSWVKVRLTVSVVRPRKSPISLRLMGTDTGLPGWPRCSARRDSMSRKDATFSRAVLRPSSSICSWATASSWLAMLSSRRSIWG